jgi:hypothetical protein
LRRQIRARSREIELSDEHETFSSDAANLHCDDALADAGALHAAIGAAWVFTRRVEPLRCWNPLPNEASSDASVIQVTVQDVVRCDL